MEEKYEISKFLKLPCYNMRDYIYTLKVVVCIEKVLESSVPMEIVKKAGLKTMKRNHVTRPGAEEACWTYIHHLFARIRVQTQVSLILNLHSWS